MGCILSAVALTSSLLLLRAELRLLRLYANAPAARLRRAAAAHHHGTRGSMLTLQPVHHVDEPRLLLRALQKSVLLP